MKKIAAVIIFFAVGLMPIRLPAQETEQPGAASPEQAAPQHFYRLNLVVKEVDEAGKVVNARSYFMTVVTATTKYSAPQIIKTGSRMPIVTGTSGGNTQIQYIDLGMDFDVRNVSESGDSLSFGLRAEISSIASNVSEASSPLRGEPVIRQNSWDSMVKIPIGKPTVVSSADDLDSKGKLQVEVTATRIE